MAEDSETIAKKKKKPRTFTFTLGGLFKLGLMVAAICVGSWFASDYLAQLRAEQDMATVVANPITRAIMENNKCYDKAGKLVGKGPGCDIDNVREGVQAVIHVAIKYKLDVKWVVRMFRVESNFDKYAVSEKLAFSRGQVLDAVWTPTLKAAGIIESSWDLFDNIKGAEAAAYVFSYYLKKAGGDYEKATRAYYAGDRQIFRPTDEGNVYLAKVKAVQI